jgi:2-oxoglutarate ferredoxin oxidoreductase subunit alpha
MPSAGQEPRKAFGRIPDGERCRFCVVNRRDLPQGSGGVTSGKEFAWSIGGTAGEGLETAGELIAALTAGLGHSPSTGRDFPSRIRGGDTTFTVRLTDGGYLAPPPAIDLSLTFNATVAPRMAAKLGPNALWLVDEGVEVDGPATAFPFTALAKQAGSPRAKNMVALGATAALALLDLGALQKQVSSHFARKGEKIQAINAAAIQLGFDEATMRFTQRFDLPTPQDGPAILLSGNQAACLGALAAGCRFAAAYPITPASDVLEYLTPRLEKLGGMALQMEDEMAALNACIGASFAGARAITATSGPGISLMTETMGLAGSTETPVVVLDCQRPGPSTGMPTKHSQDDLWHLTMGGHGEDVRIVLAPMDVADAFHITSEAFRLAHKFRAPAFVALDQQCSLMKQTVTPFDVAGESARHPKRRPVSHDGDAWSGAFDAYGDDPADVPIPGESGPYLANSTEHGPSGFTTEDPGLRVAMVERRIARMQDIRDGADSPVVVEGDGDVAVVVCGSTTGAAREAAAGDARVVAIRLLWPFPVDAVRAAIGDRRVVVAEANGFAQLAGLLKMHLPVHDRLTSCIRYDGNPVSAEDIRRCM